MARKTLYFDSFCGYTVSAVTENEKITEFNFEKYDGGCALGNIYKARVESVLPGMRAAFVNCGLAKNCYLSADDFLPDDCKPDDNALPEREMPDLKPGDEIVVQVVKMPVGNKGAKVSCNLTFVGKTLIYMPYTPYIGVSRKISDSELRGNLTYTAKTLVSQNEGIVIRTAAPYARRRQMEEELSYLKNLRKGIESTLPTAEVGQLLYTDFALPIRVLRDTLSTDIDSIVVGSQKLAELIENIVNLYPPRSRRPVIVHDTGKDMMDDLGLSSQFLEITSPRVRLENGAYLVIEPTEALTVIDVNTGSFTGDDSLEQTVYYTNILAAREIARQVRLRNIGGIVVVDFIDMQQTAHRKALVEELERALKNDRAKCTVSPMSRFGLVEFTRKRIGVSPLSMIVKPCKHCGGTGNVRTGVFILMGLRARILSMLAQSRDDLRIDMNNEVCSLLLGWKELRAELRKRAKGAKIYVVPHRTYNDERVNIRSAPFNVPYDAVEL